MLLLLSLALGLASTVPSPYPAHLAYSTAHPPHTHLAISRGVGESGLHTLPSVVLGGLLPRRPSPLSEDKISCACRREGGPDPHTKT